MAELADAYGSGPYEGNFMQVQVLLPAPKETNVEPVSYTHLKENNRFRRITRKPAVIKERITVTVGKYVYKRQGNRT